MIHLEKIRGLHVLTDYQAVRQAPVTRDLTEAVEMTLRGGARVIQLRDKNATTDDRIALGQKLKPHIRRAGALFVVNDDAEATLALDADGTHIGQSDVAVGKARKIIGPHRILGVSVETVAQAKIAEAEGADYVGVTVFSSPVTKTDARPIGMGGLEKIANASALPVVGIGGINLRTIADVFDAGATGVAVVGAVLRTTDPEAATRELITNSKRTRSGIK